MTNALTPADRSNVPPFVVMDVMNAAAAYEAQGKAAYHLEVGQPSTGAPKGVIIAAEHALRTEKLGYTSAVGIDALRERISTHYLETQGLKVSPERILITPGSSGAFVLGFLCAFNPGDRVAIAAPGYSCYRNILQALGVEVLSIPCDAETRFQITPKSLAAIPGGVNGVIVASPSNPTGSIILPADLRELATYCDDNQIILFSDEIYHGIEFEHRATSAIAYNDNAISINSFSKYFSMTGWRVGWMVVPEVFVRPIERLAQNLVISTSTLSQIAAIAAFDCHDELQLHIARYRLNRSIILDTLAKAGVHNVAPPDGAFYIYADVPHLTNDSPRFCNDLLQATGVAITPGVDSDPERGQTAIRFSYATSTEAVRDAMALCGPYLRNR